MVAGPLAERYQLPVAVIGFHKGVGSGSLRGPAGVQLHTALCQVTDCLERFGGHQAAAGVTIKLPRLEEFRERFAEAIAAVPALPASGQHQLQPNCSGESLAELVADLARIDPCCEANPRPALAFPG